MGGHYTLQFPMEARPSGCFSSARPFDLNSPVPAAPVSADDAAVPGALPGQLYRYYVFYLLIWIFLFIWDKSNL